jgi:hypothetical protein
LDENAELQSFATLSANQEIIEATEIDGEVQLRYATASESADGGKQYTEYGVVTKEESKKLFTFSDPLEYYYTDLILSPDNSKLFAEVSDPATGLMEKLVTVNVQVNDGDGGIVTDSTTVTVINTAPTANAGDGYEVYEGESIALDASATTDLEQDPASLTYTWDLDGDGAYDDATGITTTFSALMLAGPMSVTVGLQVMDDQGLVGLDTAVINILDVPSTAYVIYLPLIIRNP